ncbi:MAG: stage II sporulation protein M, partial [Desulfobacterales bacterium]
MIIDLQKFIKEERAYWSELESVLDRLEKRPELTMSLSSLERFHYLYQRTSGDLAKIKTFASEPNTLAFLESLVARAFGEIHETREKPHRLEPLRWFFSIFPQT